MDKFKNLHIMCYLLMAGSFFYTIQAMLGYGDDNDEVRSFQEIALKGFKRVLGISSLDDDGILRTFFNLPPYRRTYAKKQRVSDSVC